MYKIEMIFIIFLFILSCNLFIFNYNHIIMNLIILEFLIINTLMLIYTNFNFLNLNIFFISLFLTISICESIMGLSILVLMIRISGNDMIKFLNLTKW